ncbi:MAG: hypothetical protein K0S81_1851 [Rhodospirillales bacterium]|nr:hypothetical protein [Rhodospirillales bacterium]
MIYDEWFAGAIPADWERVASLRIERRNKILPSGEMSIYATGPDEAQRIEEALASFAPTLPPGSTLVRHGPQPAAGTLSFDALSSRSK